MLEKNKCTNKTKKIWNYFLTLKSQQSSQSLENGSLSFTGGFLYKFHYKGSKKPKCITFHPSSRQLNDSFNIYPYWKQGHNYNLITYFAKVQLKTLFSISGSCWYIFSPSFLFKNVVSERFGYIFEPHQSSRKYYILKT